MKILNGVLAFSILLSSGSMHAMVAPSLYSIKAMFKMPFNFLKAYIIKNMLASSLNGTSLNADVVLNQLPLNGAEGAADRFGSALNPDRIADALVKASGKSVEAIAEALKKHAAEGGNFSEASKNFATIFKRLFEDQGEGREAVNEAVKSVGDLFRNGGEGLTGFQDAMDNITAELGEGGHVNRVRQSATREFGQLTHDVSDHTTKLIDEVGKHTEEFVDHINEHSTQLVDDLGMHAKKASDIINKSLQAHLIKYGVISTAIIAGTTSAYYSSKVLWNWFAWRMKQPELIIESSKKSWFGWAKEKIFGPDKKLVCPMVFADDLKERLQNVATSAKTIAQKVNQGRTNVKYRNLLLHGEPGTGKTMFAKQLAYQSGMGFVMITGASFSKFIEKGEGINAMDKLFAWANRSKKGLVIFIDEIEAFVYKREKMKPGSFDLKALDNFLNHTGERSNKFMLVMATNHKEMLDKAVWDRIDDEITIPVPAFEQRVDVLKLYRDIVLFDEKQNGKEFVASAKKELDNDKINEIAEKTEGLSNRALESLINIIKTEADITSDGLLNKKLIDASVERVVHKYHAAKATA